MSDQLAAAAKALDVALDRHFGSLTKPLSILPELQDLRTALAAHEARAVREGNGTRPHSVEHAVRKLMDPPTAKPDEARVREAAQSAAVACQNSGGRLWSLCIADAIRPYIVPPRPTPGEVSVPVKQLREWRCEHHARNCETRPPSWVKHSDELYVDERCCLVCKEMTAILPPAAPPVPEPDEEQKAEWIEEFVEWFKDAWPSAPVGERYKPMQAWFAARLRDWRARQAQKGGA